ncbi:MAG: carbohydrate kinase family protein [Candidatus Acidiferrales bacterium]
MADVCVPVDVVGVGLNACDTIIRVPHFPAPDCKVEILSVDVRPGGQVASAMVACQRWGLRARYIGKVGDDAAAQQHEAEFRRFGVEAHLLRVANCPSQLAYILVDEKSGERTILWKRDSRLEMGAGEIDAEWIRSGRTLLVDGHDTQAAIAAAKFAREAKIPVFADLDNIYPGVEKLLCKVDFLISSREFPARLLGGKSLGDALVEIRQTYGCRVAGSTLGAAGVVAWDGSEFFYCPGFVVKAVDTTGAGDIFHGAFIHELLHGRNLKEILEFSNAAAALNCTAIGARGRIASLTEIENLIATGKRHSTAFDPLREGCFSSSEGSQPA